MARNRWGIVTPFPWANYVSLKRNNCRSGPVGTIQHWAGSIVWRRAICWGMARPFLAPMVGPRPARPGGMEDGSRWKRPAGGNVEIVAGPSFPIGVRFLYLARARPAGGILRSISYCSRNRGGPIYYSIGRRPISRPLAAATQRPGPECKGIRDRGHLFFVSRKLGKFRHVPHDPDIARYPNAIRPPGPIC